MSSRDEAVQVWDPDGTSSWRIEPYLDELHERGLIVWGEDALAAIRDPVQGRITTAEIEAKREAS